ncbi:MAG: hypothetical protein ACRCUK_05095, partial [Plesiomonas shigelloides]
MRRTTPRWPLRAGALLGSLLLLAGCDSGEQQDLETVLQDIYQEVPQERISAPKALERTGRL